MRKRRLGREGKYAGHLTGLLLYFIKYLIIKFNSCLFTCKLNNTEANYKVSTSTQKYTKIIKEQNTKYGSLYNGNKLIIISRKIKFSINRREK
jgi:hypothetical protein